MAFNLKTAIPIVEKEGKSFSKGKFDLSAAIPYTVEEETTFEKDSQKGASLRSYTPTWMDKINEGLEAIGLRPGRIERIGKAQAEVLEANEIEAKGETTFDDALLTILSRNRADPIEAIKTFGDVLVRTPKAIGIAVLKMHQGAEGASVVDKGWTTRLLREASEDSAKFSQEVLKRHREKRILPGVPIKITDVAQLSESMAYSITSMGSGFAVGGPIALAPVPGARVAAWATGTVASGKAAFEMSTYEIMQEFLEFKNEQSFDKLNRGLNAEEEKIWKKSFNKKATEFGLWEAVPEALSNLAFVGLLTAPLTKMFGTTLAARVTTRLTGLYGEELLTETITEKFQTGIRREAGLEEGEPNITWEEAFKRVAPQTFLLTTIMAGTGSTIIKIKKSIKNSLKKEIGENHPEFEKINKGADEMIIAPGEGFEGEGKIKSTSKEFAQEKPTEAPQKPTVKPGEPIEGVVVPEVAKPSKEIVAEKILRQEALTAEETEAFPDLKKIEARFKDLKAKEALVIEGKSKAMIPFERKELTKLTEDLGGLVREKIKKAPSAKKILGVKLSPFVKIREMTLLKEKIKTLLRGIRMGEIQTKKDIKQSQTIVIDILDKSDLEAKDKAKFIRAIKNIQTPQQLARALPEIEERVTVLEEKAEVRNLKSKISKELKSIKLKKQAGKKVGRFTADIQGALELIKRIEKMTPVEAEDTIAKNLENVTGLLPSEDIRLQNELLGLVSGFEAKDATSLKGILNKIQELKKQGKEARELLKTDKRERIEKLRETVIEQVTGGKGIKPGRETTGENKVTRDKIKSAFRGLGVRWILSWNGIMETLEFNAGVDNKKLKNIFGVLDQENKTKELELEFRKDFDEIISESYGIENKPTKIHKKLNDLSQDIKLGKFKNRAGVEVELIFSKDEIIKKWMEFQDVTLIESFEEGNKFTDEIIEVINNQMNNKDKVFARKQFDLYKKQWRKINPTYRKFFGVNLAFNDFYSPIAREGFQIDQSKAFGQLLEDNAKRLGVTSKSLKARVKNALPLKTQGSVNVLDRHVKETNYFLAWAEKIKEIESVFKDNNVIEAIKQEFSPGVLKAVGSTIEDIVTKGNRNARRYPVIDAFRKNFTLGKLMIKPSLAAKQFVSTFAYLEKLNPIDFTLGIADFWLTNPLKNYKTLLKESTLIKTRGANMERDIAEATKSTIFKQYSKRQSFLNVLMLNVRLGDKSAIVWGSWAIRKARLKQNVPIADIVKEYEDFSADTQQSADISRLSEVQRGGSLEKLFTMFKSSQRQYLAKELNAVKSLFQKGGFSEKNIKKVARVLAIYHVLLPAIFQFIANAGGWDDEDKKDYLRAGILGSLNGLFIFGDVIDSVIRKALGLRVWSLEIPIVSIKNSIISAMSKIDWDNILAKDVLEALAKLSESLDSLAIPATQVRNMIIGTGDLMNGDIKEGVLEILGWSPNVVKEKKKGTRPKI